MLKKITAIAFDLDGTLVDTAPDLTSSLNHVLHKAGRRPLAPSVVRDMIGDGVAKLIERGFAETGGGLKEADMPALMELFLAYYADHIADESRAFPGVVETLKAFRAQGIALGVCTNKPRDATDALLKALDLTQYFAGVGAGDGPRKPDPRSLLGLLERMGQKPEDAIMVGDSHNDVAASRAAGVPVIVVTFGYTTTPPRQLGADVVVERFDELPPIISRWGQPKPA